MQVQSTGLGKTMLTAHMANLEANNDGLGFGLTLKIEATEPVHWYITCRLTPTDIRRTLKLVLTPSVLFRVLKMLFQGSPAEAPAAAPAAEAQKST